ncbi:MAG: hypothetical protein K2I35_06900, partial [Duncaniella sp.]|nr:hypothetical protein [Duncaniella sp.]
LLRRRVGWELFIRDRPDDFESFYWPNSHFNPYGAYEVAKCVAEGLRTAAPELAKHLIDFEGFNPAQPDDFESFYWPNSPFTETLKPYGN